MAIRALILLFLLGTSSVCAQQAVYDSVNTSVAHRPLKERFQIMEQFADSLLYRPYDALPFTHEAVSLARQLGDKREEGYLLNSLAKIYQSIGEFDSSGDYVRMAITLNREIKHDVEIARSYNSIAVTYYYMGLYYNAMEFDLKALAIYEQLKKTVHASVVLNTIGSIYLRLGQYEKAREYYARSLAVTGKKDTTTFRLLVYANLASTYWQQHQPDSALLDLYPLLAFAQKKKNIGAEAWVRYNIGMAYLEKGNYPEAIRFLEEARSQSSSIHEAHGEAEAMIGIAKAYAKRGDNTKVLALLEHAIRYCRRVKTYDLLLSALKLRCEAYEKQGEVRHAYASLKEYSMLLDSVSALSEKIGIANSAFAFDLARKEDEISRLRQDAMNDELSIRNQRIWIISLAAFMLLVIFMYRKANRLRKIEAEQKVKIESLYGQLQTEVAERRIADEQARESRSRFQAIWEMSVDGMRLTDQDGIIVMVNESFCRMVGMTREELEGQPLSVLYRPEAGEKVISTYRRHFSEHRIEPYFERELHLKCGRRIWFEVTNTYIKAEDDSLLLLGIFRDVTHRRRLEQQLVQAQKLEGIGTLAGGIAHDFNNLLAMILGSAEMLQSRIESQPQLQKYVDRIVQASARGTSISRQLLIFSRPDQVELKPMSLSKTIGELRDMLAHFLPKSIAIRTVIETDDDAILGDAGQIQQAILNLAINAGDAMKGSGVLTIRQYPASNDSLKAKFPDLSEAGYIALSVTDTGIGMDDAVKAKIFDPFFTTKERSKGTGLGLSSVHGIMKNHHGLIDVESTPGTGTTFTLYFPRVDAGLAQQEPGGKPAAAGQQRTVLLVDDEDVIRETLQEYLSSAGYRVFAAPGGREAFEVFTAHRETIDLVLTDLGMPDMGGEELCRRVLAVNPTVPIIVASGYLDGTTKDDLLALGVRNVLSKPAKIGDIDTAIRSVLDQAGNEAASRRRNPALY